MDEDEQKQVLLKAIAITEWTGAYEAICALEKVGIEVNQRTKWGIRRELRTFIDSWPRVTSPVLTDDEVKQEARAYLTKHQAELEELLAGGG